MEALQKFVFDKLQKEEDVSEKILKIAHLVLNDINTKGTHLSDLKTVSFVDFNTFKSNVLKKTKRTILEDWILGIKYVEILFDEDSDGDYAEGYIINHQNGRMVLPFYDVESSTYKLFESSKTRKAKFDNKSLHWRHLVDRGNSQTSVSYERLMMIADGVYRDCLPDNLKGLQCNVMDCTGNPYTAELFKAKQCFEPSNLEWVFGQEHGTHYNMVMRIFNITGKLWRISARDRYLYELTQNGTTTDISQYLKCFVF